MNEVAWCYLEGFGCKKDKVSLQTCATRIPCFSEAPAFKGREPIDRQARPQVPGEPISGRSLPCSLVHGPRRLVGTSRSLGLRAAISLAA